MPILFIQITRYLLCFVSMLLTGLFALSFSSTVPLASELPIVEKNYMAPLLLVAVGMAIDLSKYLFWQYRDKANLFLLISLLLVLFSWAASLAFFLTQEQSNIKATQRQTPAYQAHQIEADRLRQAIAEKRLLLRKRLQSQYHAQWEKADDTMEAINTLEKELTVLLRKNSTVGLTAARQQLSTSAFFISIAGLSGFSSATVAVIAYGALALLIELCALGTISLAQVVKASHHKIHENVSAKTKQSKPVNKKTTLSGSLQSKINQKKARLRQAIINGTVVPAIRKIKRSGYGLSEANIRQVLQELKSEGRLVEGKRHLQLPQTTIAE